MRVQVLFHFGWCRLKPHLVATQPGVITRYEIAHAPSNSAGVQVLGSSLSSTSKIRLLIVDDHPVVCEGLRSILLHAPQIELVGVCWTGKSALRLAISTRIDLMLIDLRMAPMNGLELLFELNRNSIRCKALVLANSEPDEEVFESIEAGAVGWLCKNMPPSDILKRILAAAAGETVFPSNLSPHLGRRHVKRTLTAREVEVLNLVSKGLSNKEVGNLLGLSQFTVRNQMKRICTKLNASDRTQASTTAMERGIIRP